MGSLPFELSAPLALGIVHVAFMLCILPFSAAECRGNVIHCVYCLAGGG